MERNTKYNPISALRKERFPFPSCLHQSQSACTSAEISDDIRALGKILDKKRKGANYKHHMH